MDFKLILIATITAFAIIIAFHELIKEKSKAKKDKEQRNELMDFFKKVGIQLSESSLTNKELLKYLTISSQKYADEITESQARIIIDSILSNSQTEVHNYLSKIISENHIKGNEKETASKIKLFISNRFHKDFLLFKEFQYKEKILGCYDGMNNWKEYIMENVLDVVIKEKGEKVLHGTLQNSYDSFKYDMLDKTIS